MRASHSFTCKRHEQYVVFTRGERQVRLCFITPSIVRVTCTEGKPFADTPSRIVTAERRGISFSLDEDDGCWQVSTANLRVQFDKNTGAQQYRRADGSLLLREPATGGKRMQSRPVQRNVFAREQAIAFAQSIDGARAAATEYRTVLDRNVFEAELAFVFAEDEAIFGLGSHEEGYGNLRGKSRDLYQQNMKAVIPYFVSTRGYGVLLDCASLMTFRDGPSGAHWWADAVEELDFYIIEGHSFDEVTQGYYALTGIPPMLPKWAFGYLQSKERYVHAREMVEVVREYRRRHIPLDGIVLDWKSWPDGDGWGQKSLDPVRFPEPRAFTDELHALGAHLMVSIWPIMTGGCANQRELLAADLMLGNQSTYNAFLPAARAIYWQQAERELFSAGVDAWWCDCTEPFEADWSGAIKPESQARLDLNTRESKLYLDPTEINAYSLVHAEGIYTGQRSTGTSKRVLNLTRSSYAGQHRYGTVTWSGDVTATWETLRRSIPEGVNFCAAGEPFWSVDIGGFFVDHRPDLWFWRGDYPASCRGLTAMDASEPDPHDTGSTDFGYRELYVRWLQYAAFLPMFRSHGTDVAREVWRFGEEGSPFYDAICQCIRLRYSLAPYIYSLAAQVTRAGAMMVRAVALDFPADIHTHSLLDQYLFGSALLVCPVTQPMYYNHNSQPIVSSLKSRVVYLPAGSAWFDFWTGASFAGGTTIAAGAPLEIIPLFARAGSILPLGPEKQFMDEHPEAAYEIRVYAGADGHFALYEDAGDSYDYEQGCFSLVQFAWNDSAATLTLGARQGEFSTLVRKREYALYLYTGEAPSEQRVLYTGEELHVQMRRATQ